MAIVKIYLVLGPDKVKTSYGGVLFELMFQCFRLPELLAGQCGGSRQRQESASLVPDPGDEQVIS